MDSRWRPNQHPDTGTTRTGQTQGVEAEDRSAGRRSPELEAELKATLVSVPDRVRVG
jgi:hypothetical protein